MALREIRKEGDPVLRKVCKPVENIDDRLSILLDDMAETMHNANGVGLAAPQIGIIKRIAIVDTGEEILELINPEMIQSKGRQNSQEGCLSIPGLSGNVKRPLRVKIKAKDRAGNSFIYEAEGFTAVAICHELDHLDGILYKDKATNLQSNQ